MKRLISSATLMLLCYWLSAQGIERYVIAASGGETTNSSFTLGQAIVGTTNGQNHILLQGYQQPSDKTNTTNSIDYQLLESFKVFPNPTNHILNISGRLSKKTRGSIRIENILGQNLLNQEFKTTEILQEQVELRSINPGIYFLKLYSSDGGLLISEQILIIE